MEIETRTTRRRRPPTEFKIGSVYSYNGNNYRVLHVTKMKSTIKGRWRTGVYYCDENNLNQTYCMPMRDFLRIFDPLGV